MRIRIWNLPCAFLTLAVFFFAGCEARPAAGPLPVRVAQTATAPAPHAGAVTTSATPLPPASLNSDTPAPANPGFSLPIGADIPPTAADSAPSATGKATLSVPPLAEQGQPPQPASSPAIQTTSQTSSTPAGAPGASVQLSAGIAVPQSLPIGTVMAISVDYTLRGNLSGSSRYVWVVKSTTEDMVTDVKLDQSGNLSAFFQQLRPEHRPFSVRIEEVTPGSKRRTVISNELPLKTDY